MNHEPVSPVLATPSPVHRARPIGLLASALGLAATLAGCQLAPTAGPATAGSGATQPVTIRFAAAIGDQPFECGRQYGGIGTTKSTITPNDLRWFVSEVALIDAAGRRVPVQLAQDGSWQVEDIALLDFENGSGPCLNGTRGTRDRVEGRVPAGDYRGLEFTLGVPFGRNHGDPTVAPVPLNVTAMFWNWQGGYKFLKFDAMSSGMRPAAAGGHGAMAGHGAAPAPGFALHLGSTQCASAARTEAPSAPCRNPNRVVVRFDRFDPATQVVVADLAAVLAEANVDVNTAGTAPGCMSFPGDPDCVPVMRALGLAYGDRPADGPQRLFRAR